MKQFELEKFSPIALFVYNRPVHTKKTIEALIKNKEAKDSIIYIFSDYPKSINDEDNVKTVRRYIDGVDGFKKVVVVKQLENFGLAKSIITGVTRLCDDYGRVIVIEDDLETSEFFLKFMNDSLDFYKDTSEVMHISGCRYPVENFGKQETFFLQVPLCWGWATWKRAWNEFDKDLNLINKFDSKMKRNFNFDNTYPYWRQLEENKSGKINTWFVFWYVNIFLKKGLCLFPSRSMVNNIGMDNTGVNCSVTDDYNVTLSLRPVAIELIDLKLSDDGFISHKKYFKKIKDKLIAKIIRKIKKIIYA